MKLPQFTLIFAVIAISVIVIIDTRMEYQSAYFQATQRMERCLSEAVKSAGRVYSLQRNISPEDIRIEFFRSFAASLGHEATPDFMNRLKICVPIFCVLTNEGMYVFNQAENDVNEIGIGTEKEGTWTTELSYCTLKKSLPVVGTLSGEVKFVVETEEGFSFSEPYSDLNLSREICAEATENVCEYYSDLYNEMQKKRDGYQFSFPQEDTSEWIRACSYPGIIVLFYGAPLSNGLDSYQSFLVGGAQLIENDGYHIADVDGIRTLHHPDCPVLLEYYLRQEKAGVKTKKEKYNNYQECAEAGAVCVPCCEPLSGKQKK